MPARERDVVMVRQSLVIRLRHFQDDDLRIWLNSLPAVSPALGTGPCAVREREIVVVAARVVDDPNRPACGTVKWPSSSRGGWAERLPPAPWTLADRLLSHAASMVARVRAASTAPSGAENAKRTRMMMRVSLPCASASPPETCARTSPTPVTAEKQEVDPVSRRN